MKKNHKLLILGGNSSFAHNLIEYSQKEQYEIFATFRGEKSLLATKEVNLLSLDITNLTSIEKFLTQINDYRISYVACLIGSLSEINTRNVYEESKKYIETYVTNLVYLLEGLQQKNRLSNNCRVLIMSSRAVKYGSFDYYYAISKAAVEAYVKSKSKSSPQIRINSVSTGLVQGSKMYINMPIEIVENHNLRANNKLLVLSDVANELIDIFKREDVVSGDTLYIGPQYE